MPPEPLAEAITALSRFLVSNASLGDTLQRVAEITQQAVPPAALVGISMLDEGGEPSTTIFTDDEATEIDQAQYQTGSGPCLDAWRLKRVVRINDVTAPGGDYPEFRRAAAAHGMLSTLTLPLVVGDDGIGALNLYADAKEAFSSADESLSGDLATTAAVVLANAAAYWGAYQLNEDMRAAMESRAVVEQAKGVLMAQSPGLDAEGAFELLVERARRENARLREIARRTISREPPAESG